MTPRVAIIIPTCDRPPAILERAVRSALAQRHPAHEIIVVNDGLGPVSLPPGVRGLRSGGYRGPGWARNLALCNLSRQTTAVTYLDDDDELLPDHVGLLSEAIAQGAAFAFSRALYKYPGGVETEDPEPGNTDPNKRYYCPDALLDQNIAPISCFMHSVAAVEAIGYWDDTLLRMEDWDFWGRMAIAHGPPRFVDAVTNVIHKDQAANRTTGNQFSYSMSCSWRDIVAARLKAMAADKSPLVNAYRDRFHVPKVGVVMPVYNAERHLRQALDSILAQTLEDFEILAVYDGATDSSGPILEEYRKKDPRVRVFGWNTNRGVTKALNFGLLVSRSEYVARMDADDYALPDRLRLQSEFLDKHRDVSLVGTRFLSMNEDLSRVNWVNDVPLEPEKIAATLPDHCCLGHPTVMFRRTMVERVGGYDESEEFRAVEDYELWLRASGVGVRMANLPQYLLYYREYGGQVSSRMGQIQKDNARRLREKYAGPV